jgi:hypothetical protein
VAKFRICGLLLVWPGNVANAIANTVKKSRLQLALTMNGNIEGAVKMGVLIKQTPPLREVKGALLLTRLRRLSVYNLSLKRQAIILRSVYLNHSDGSLQKINPANPASGSMVSAPARYANSPLGDCRRMLYSPGGALGATVILKLITG